MATDGLATQGAGPSAAMILTLFSWKNLAAAIFFIPDPKRKDKFHVIITFRPWPILSVRSLSIKNIIWQASTDLKKNQ